MPLLPVDMTIQMIPIDTIHGRYQERVRPSARHQARLTEHIALHGLKKPIAVRPAPDGDGYQLLAGERRVTAFRTLGLANIPAYVYDWSDDDLERMSVRAHCCGCASVSVGPPSISFTTKTRLVQHAATLLRRVMRKEP